MLLAIIPQTRATAAYWVSQTANATIICYKRGSGFPVIETDYATLIRHPERPDEEQRKEMTAGSILYPVLAAFAWGLGDSELVAQIDAFQQESLGHCNFQTWVPNARTEARIWQGERTGSSFGSLTIGKDGDTLMASLHREIKQNNAYKDLSAISLDHWPVLLMACRAYRMPPPPQLWLPLLDELKVPRAAEAGEWVSGPPRSRGGKKKVRSLLLRCVSYTALMRGFQGTARFDTIRQIASI